jgi:hypothetical protein
LTELTGAEFSISNSTIYPPTLSLHYPLFTKA